jgi:PTH1 family peptidyl-tRNA hydrolase
VRLIVGLGNPGRRYSGTRHNAGWMAADRVAALAGVETEVFSRDGVLARSGDLFLLKPLGYMNRSGPPVSRLLDELGAAVDELLVFVDDMALPLGRVRLRAGGSSGGHRGMASVAEALGTEQFPRLRMGIGACPAGSDAYEYVLSRFTEEERPAVEEMVDRAAQAALCWARDGIDAAMTRFNVASADGPS